MKRSIWHTIFKIIWNKYFLSFLGFAVWITFFDQNNLIDRYNTRRHLNQLKQDTAYYHRQIEKEQKLIEELQKSPAGLEKYAREQYRMKRADEDVFVILKKSEIR